MAIEGALPNEYLASVQEALASLHLRERQRRERAGGKLYGPAGFGEPIEFRPGLSNAECSALAERFGLRFPPDLRSFLQLTLPVRADEFPNWRDDAANELQLDQDYLLRGIWNDIDPHQQPYFDMNAEGSRELVTPTFQPRLWSPTWGRVPEDRDAAYAVVSEQLARAPRFIRVFAHRFMPDTPAESGNPVFSIVQTDIIHYGDDLAGYFTAEFGAPLSNWAAKAPRDIPFWSELVRLNDG